MKKFFSLITIVFVLLFINFTVWFMHTRTIKNAVENMSKQLAVKGIDLKYKNIRFINFTSWKVKAVIDDIYIDYGNSVYNARVAFEKLDIVSQPLKKVIEILLPTSIAIKTERKGFKEDSVIKYDKPSFLRIHLNKSLSSVANNYETDNYKSIKQLLYFAENSKVFDNHNKEVISSFDQISFWIVNSFNDSEFTSGIKLLISGLKYDPLYKTQQISAQRAHDKSTVLGNIKFEIDIFYSELLNNKSSTTLQNQNFIKKFEVKSISMDTEIFNFNFDGNLIFTKADPFPYMNINVSIGNYKSLIDYYAAMINLYIDTLNASQTIAPLKKINNEQKNALSNIIRKLSIEKNESMVKLNIFRNRDKTTISSRPILLIIKQLSALFFSNLQMNIT